MQPYYLTYVIFIVLQFETIVSSLTDDEHTVPGVESPFGYEFTGFYEKFRFGFWPKMICF